MSYPYQPIVYSAESLQEAWVNLNTNLAFATDQDSHSFISSRDFGSGLHGVILTAREFGLTKDEGQLWYPSLTRRVNTLTKRYVQPEFWEQGLKNLHEIQRFHRGYSQAGSMQFVRWEKIPTGGGCLLDMTVLRVRGYAYELHLNSRAVESVKFLTGDMHFAWTILHRIAHQLDWPELLLNMQQISWRFSLLQQSRDFTLAFLMRHKGLETVREYLEYPWEKGTWPYVVVKYFYDYFMHPQPPRFNYKQKAIQTFFKLSGMSRTDFASQVLDWDTPHSNTLSDWWDYDYKIAFRGTDDWEYMRRNNGEAPVYPVGVWDGGHPEDWNPTMPTERRELHSPASWEEAEDD